MAIEAVKIPQNVYVEDRIIGPVTMRQLIITGIGAGISYVLYAAATKAGYIGIPVVVICWSPALVAAAFAFLKINDLTLFNIILLTIESTNKPNIRYWSPHQGFSINLVTGQNSKDMRAAENKAAASIAKLTDLTKQMEQRHQEMNDISAQSAKISDVVAATRTPEPVSDKPAALRVRPERVQTEGLSKERSIDGIADVIAKSSLTSAS